MPGSMGVANEAMDVARSKNPRRRREIERGWVAHPFRGGGAIVPALPLSRYSGRGQGLSPLAALRLAKSIAPPSLKRRATRRDANRASQISKAPIHKGTRNTKRCTFARSAVIGTISKTDRLR